VKALSEINYGWASDEVTGCTGIETGFLSYVRGIVNTTLELSDEAVTITNC
jgi:hypothetical protein